MPSANSMGAAGRVSQLVPVLRTHVCLSNGTSRGLQRSTRRSLSTSHRDRAQLTLVAITSRTRRSWTLHPELSWPHFGG